MNNNNNRNNRRRGRGNRSQGGNGAQLNRIDSRARGNAPQMLDKYKKLAQDAHHNGDRVQMEYYLQFADHYFRVIADNKARVDEQRGPGANARRNDERDQAEDYGDDDIDFGSVRRNDQSTRSRYEQQDNAPRAGADDSEQGEDSESFARDSRDDERGDGRSDDSHADRGNQQARQPNARRQPRKAPREGGREGGRENGREGGRDDNRAERPERAPRPPRAERAERAEGGENRSDRAEASRPETAAEPRADKPARARRPRKAADDDRAVIDSSILPPSIRGDDGGSGESGGALETVD
ncbi:DUF4167 domain-containing protein [Porphyrobacter sp. TH134]|uniref:DUF4167 domain-containing protein n=1 Tax=Porphyrobacter sp. TH134 TaxID=2067450 RepID=UPI000C7C7D77|nr:DUF4167 domain-containing protein [Porphyrobacter sp. TH134]PLK25407.1 DUF4167 domain-containing protein [Porphyrobacter sp. TH134]